MNKNITALISAATLLIFGCSQMQEKNEAAETVNTTAEPVKVKQQKPVDKNLLTGDWVRTDAEYRIQISELQNDGKMKAGYFNPKSINVDKAMWAFDAGLLKIYIELKDENYPGSNYDLIYFQEKDMLAGKYFQAVEGVIYDVGFVRKNK
jgi:hypothetical protein